MTYNSILFLKDNDRKKAENAAVPNFFNDLNLDQIISKITSSKASYNLEPFFYYPLNDTESIYYRHEVIKDLENQTLYSYLKSFEEKIILMRKNLNLSEKLYYKYQKERLFLDAVNDYCKAVIELNEDLDKCELKSQGLLLFRNYLKKYTESDEFQLLKEDTKNLLENLSDIKYCIQIKDNTVTVRNYQGETDFSDEVLNIFDKFKQSAPKDYRVKFRESIEMNHVEESILGIVAKLNPDVFSNLDNYFKKNTNYLDEKIKDFNREIQFYISYLDYIKTHENTGLKFCLPEILNNNKEIYVKGGFDLALADKLNFEDLQVVTNDFSFKDNERIFIVSGPNQGGKTTFARAFGQLHYLASLGCPVPGEKAKLYLFDNIFTHFEREENIKNLQGKLQDDLVRIHDILNEATSDSIIIANEIFSSTTLQDAIKLGKKVLEKIIKLDAVCVYVTFVDELASLDKKIVSMVSMVVPENPAERTFKIVRKPADGLSYAIYIAEKYNLTYEKLKERLNK